MAKIFIFGIVFFITVFYAKADTVSYSNFRSGRSVSDAPKDERAFYVDFELRTRNNKDEPETRVFSGKNLPNFKNFRSDRKTIILIPGSTIFGRGFSFYYISFLTYAFLKNGDYNVISVHWDELTDLNLMRYTLHNAVFVGELTTVLINTLNQLNETYENFTIVSHHYGTISAAVAGALLEGKLERIIALDPQSIPLYIKLPHWSHLDRTCAKIVEAVHTSESYLPVGHRDYYVNGGKKPQPGCEFDFFGSCSSEHAFLVYGIDLIFDGRLYNATYCQSYEAYLDQKCFINKNISLWNEEDVHSFPSGNYFFKTTPIKLPLTLRQSIGGRKQFAKYSHGAKHIRPFDQIS